MPTKQMHITEWYEVQVTYEGTDKSNYQVVNRHTGKVEHEAETLPQAIAVCEQYNYMLENDTYKDLLAEMFGDDPSAFADPVGDGNLLN